MRHLEPLSPTGGRGRLWQDEAMHITEFLEARIAEDEAEGDEQSITAYYDGGWSDEHVQRVLAECAAKRALLQEHVQAGPLCFGDEHEFPCATLKVIAAVYAAHPDYRPEWA